MYDFEKIKNGDKKERNRIILDNQGLVYSIAFKYAKGDIEIEDLIQEGNIGLMKAIEMFDSSRDIKFSTYAFYWIRTKIRKFVLFDSKSIRYPVYIEEKLINYNVTRDMFIKNYNREPSIDEIATALGVSAGEVSTLLQLVQGTISLNSSICDENETFLEEVIDNGEITPDNVFLEKELGMELDKVLNGVLTPNEVVVLKARYGFYGDVMTLEEVSKIFGVTRERIRQIEKKALRKLRSSEMVNLLVDFTDNPDCYRKKL